MRMVLTRRSSQRWKWKNRLMAMSMELIVDGAYPIPIKCPFHAMAVSLSSALPSSHAAKARTSRRYFSMVPGSRSSARRYPSNAVSCFPIICFPIKAPPQIVLLHFTRLRFFGKKTFLATSKRASPVDGEARFRLTASLTTDRKNLPPAGGS